MSELDDQIKLGFESLRSSETFRRGLADAIINESKRRRTKRWQRISAAILASVSFIAIGFAFGHFEFPPRSIGVNVVGKAETLTTPATGGAIPIPFSISHMVDGSNPKKNSFDVLVYLKPSENIDFLVKSDTTDQGNIGHLQVFSNPAIGQPALKADFYINSGTTVQNFGNINVEGPYRVHVVINDHYYNGYVKLDAVRNS
jgi:hypothetical protein